MTRKTVTKFALACIAAGICGAAYQFVAPHRVPEPTPAVVAPAVAVNTVTTPAARAGTAVTVASGEAAASTKYLVDDPRIQRVRTEADLLGYFDELETAARTRGKMADELDRADAAGKRLLATVPGERVALKMFDFVERMHRVSVELEVKPIYAKLDVLREQISKEHDPAARDRLVAQYTTASSKLPAPGRLGASERLKETLASAN